MLLYEHGLELIIPRLEILEIEVCDILQNPGNIGNFSFSIFLDAWKYWKSDFSISPISGAGYAPWLSISECSRFLVFFQKRRAPKFHAEWSNFHAEISHMRPIQGQKLKLEIDHFPDPLKIEQFFKASKATLG